MLSLFAALSVVGLLSTHGLLPNGIDIGQSRQSAASVLPGAALGTPMTGAFSLSTDVSVVQRSFRLTVYGRNERVTNITLHAHNDESGEAYNLLSDTLAAVLGTADSEGRAENIEAKTWTREGVTVSLRRVVNQVTELTLFDSNSIFKLQ